MIAVVRSASRLRLAAEVLATARIVRRRLSDREDIRRILDELRDVPLSAPVPRLRRQEPLRLAAATRRTLDLVPGDSRCLVQALTLSALLGRRGTPSVLVLGAWPPSRSAFAHAWVEDGAGRPLLASHGLARLATL